MESRGEDMKTVIDTHEAPRVAIDDICTSRMILLIIEIMNIVFLIAVILSILDMLYG